MAISTIKKTTLSTKTLVINHGTIDSGASSTKETPNVSDKMHVVGIAIYGSYNSDCHVWAYFLSGSTFISRVKNTGSHQATNIEVHYYYLDD